MNAVLTNKRRLTDAISILTFRATETFDFTPGQFYQINIDGKRRPYSVTSLPGKETAEFYIKSYPDGSVAHHILDLEHGDEATLQGPYGSFQLTDADGPAYLIAAGSGIAPVMSMARAIDDRNCVFLHSASYVEELGYNDELAAMEDDTFTYIPTISRPDENDWNGRTGRVHDHLDELVDTDAEVYVCGPPPMVTDVSEALKTKGFTSIYTEQYY
jgi:benzoate/toluate 1,2-dioxygenase reductase subunit